MPAFGQLTDSTAVTAANGPWALPDLAVERPRRWWRRRWDRSMSVIRRPVLGSRGRQPRRATYGDRADRAARAGRAAEPTVPATCGGRSGEPRAAGQRFAPWP